MVKNTTQNKQDEDVKISDIVDTDPDYQNNQNVDLRDLHQSQKDPTPEPLNGQNVYKIYTQSKDDKRVDESTDGLPAGTPGHQGFDEDTE